MRVLAAMSGGVDSAVAAARLVAQGHDVTGVHLALSRNPRSQREGSRGCCSLEDSFDARRAADKIGIPFYVWDFSDRFAEEVIDPFVAEYAAGRTPNPCLRCNERIKFAALLERGLDLGFDAVATGHYARLERTASGTRMYRGIDAGKDQSYVLAVLNQEQLAHSMFPLGDTVKTDIRAEAAELGLAVADKPDSNDICFIPDGNTAGWLSGELGERRGEIRDESGTVVGSHVGDCPSASPPRTASHGTCWTSSRCPTPSSSVEPRGCPSTVWSPSVRCGAPRSLPTNGTVRCR